MECQFTVGMRVVCIHDYTATASRNIFPRVPLLGHTYPVRRIVLWSWADEVGPYEVFPGIYLGGIVNPVGYFGTGGQTFTFDEPPFVHYNFRLPETRETSIEVFKCIARGARALEDA